MGVDKNMTFSELLEKHPEAAEDLMEAGMHCIGCPASSFETLEQGAEAHGINAKELVVKINKRLDGKGSGKKDKINEDEVNKKWEKMKEKKWESRSIL